MVLTKNEINRILETLPVGFYAKTKINVECADGSMSYFDESAEKIVVGVDTINLGLKKVANGFDTTIAVRTVFYHEISHLILTPHAMTLHPEYYAGELVGKIRRYTNKELTTKEAFDLINITEDERIESALRNYYMNTNFRWFVTQQYSGEPLVEPKDIFYAALRFRIGSESILKAVSELIIKYKKFTRDNWNIMTEGGWLDLGAYITDIAHLYEMCVRESEEQKKDNQNKKDDSDNNQSEKLKSDENQNGTGNSAGKNDEQSDEEPEETAAPDKASNEPGCQDGNGDRPTEFDPAEQLDYEDAEQLFAKAFDSLRNNEMINEFRRIFKQFKTRGNVGGHTNAYSGVINPRNAARSDYRYFTRTNTENNGGAGKLHLNLWIDCSGSYSSNEMVTNQIIKALEIVEHENKIFSFDVMDINQGVHVHEKNKRYIETHGGNYLTYEMDTKFKAMQKADARNYNIVLYDGMAYQSGQQKLFGAWNHDNVFIISDSDNEKPIRANCKKAKMLFVHWGCGKSYAQMLEEKIYNILRVGFGAQ